MDWDEGNNAGGDGDNDGGGQGLAERDDKERESALAERLRRLHRLLLTYLNGTLESSLPPRTGPGGIPAVPPHLRGAASGNAAALLSARQSYVANAAGGGPLGEALAESFVDDDVGDDDENVNRGGEFDLPSARDALASDRFEEEHILDDDDGDEDEDGADDDDGGNPTRADRRRELRHLPVVAAELSRSALGNFCRADEDDVGVPSFLLGPFPSLHLPPALAAFASALPPDAAEIVSRPVRWSSPDGSNSEGGRRVGATPFDLVREALESLERTGRIVQRGGGDRPGRLPGRSGMSLSGVLTSGQLPSGAAARKRKRGAVLEEADAEDLVAALVEAAGSIGDRCVRADPSDLTFRAWRLALLGGATLVSAGIEIGGGAREAEDEEHDDDEDEDEEHDERHVANGTGSSMLLDGESSGDELHSRSRRRKRRTRMARHFQIRADAGRAFRDLVERRAEMQPADVGDGPRDDDSVSVGSSNGDSAPKSEDGQQTDLRASSGGTGSLGSVFTANWHLAISNFLGWSEVVFLLIRQPVPLSHGDNSAFRHVRRLHALHTLLWAREVEEEGAGALRSGHSEETQTVRLVKGLKLSGEVTGDTLLDFLASRVERRPSCLERWMTLASELISASRCHLSSLQTSKEAQKGRVRWIDVRGRLSDWKERFFQPPNVGDAISDQSFVDTIGLVRHALDHSKSSIKVNGGSRAAAADEIVLPSDLPKGVGLDDLVLRSNLRWIVTDATIEEQRGMASYDVGNPAVTAKLKTEAFDTHQMTIEDYLPAPIGTALTRNQSAEHNTKYLLELPVSQATAGRTCHGLCLKALVASFMYRSSSFLAGVVKCLVYRIHLAHSKDGKVNTDCSEFISLCWMQQHGIDIICVLQKFEGEKYTGSK